MFPKNDNGVWEFSSVDYLETWRAMEDCVKKGYVKSIGVSNFNSKQIQRIIDNCDTRPSVNQVKCNV